MDSAFLVLGALVLSGLWGALWGYWLGQRKGFRSGFRSGCAHIRGFYARKGDSYYG